MHLSEKQNQTLIWTAVSILALIAFLVGLGISALALPKPQIGVIYVDDVISAQFLPYLSQPMNYAMEHDEIAAVVLIVDSPGGSASVSEELFYRTLQLRDKKPVVSSVRNLAASGSYYMAVASNYIYSKPAALVGSIGVVAGIPGVANPTEFQATTGPFKSGGSTAVDWIRGMEVLKDAFVGHVYEQRIYMLEHMHPESRAALLPDFDHIGTGQVWFAPVAYDIGLIDALGSDLDAIQKAAELAHVANYDIVDLTGLVIYDDPEFYFGMEAERAQPDWSQELLTEGPWPSFYHLYLPPEE